MTKKIQALSAAACAPMVVAMLCPAAAHADAQKVNSSVVSNVYTLQHQAGCTNNVRVDKQLLLAAEWQTKDMMANRELTGDLGSDGSTPQSRGEAAGFRGKVFQTVAINPALSINNLDVINQWYYDPVAYGIMADCKNTRIGVWSENSLDRSVLVAVYGQPA